MDTHSKEAGTFSRTKRTGRWRALQLGGTIAGAAVVATAFSLPAGAIDTPSANRIIVGTGSQTTFQMMGALDSLFNNAPVCNQFVPFPSATTPQELNLVCTPPVSSTAPPNPNPSDEPDNPFGDVALQEPPLGSSNGIAELEDSGAHGATATDDGTPIKVFQGVDYARSSRALTSTDLQGLNFVAYARDGVSWFHYTTVGGNNTPSHAVHNLTLTQLQGIYSGSINNWSEVGGANKPIVVYSAQEGSGTEGTWKSFIGFDPVTVTTDNCAKPKASPPTGCVGPAVIQENEDAQLNLTAFTSNQQSYLNSGLWGGKRATLAQIESDAIFFYSFGKFSSQCAHGSCGGTPLPPGTKNAVEAIGGVAPTQATILKGTFPDDRYLYNVYSNGANSNIPTANGATLNYVSEDGFLCKPENKTAVNPADGNSYLTDIQKTIENNGFYPLSGGASSGMVNQVAIDEGSVGHPAAKIMPAKYAPYDKVVKNPVTLDPTGYCLTSDTDGNPGT